MNIKFTTKPYMLLLIVSVVLFIIVFLPWWSWGVSYAGFHVGGSINGFHGGGILTFLMALAGIGLSFAEISIRKYRAYAIIAIGILALLGVLLTFAEYGGSSMGFGRILALIVSIALIGVGYMDYRGMAFPIKTGGPKASPPPPPPPPAPPAK